MCVDCIVGAVDMSMLKRIGDSGDPCGTPCVGVIVLVDSVLSVLIVICLCFRKELISFVKCVDVCVFRM